MVRETIRKLRRQIFRKSVWLDVWVSLIMGTIATGIAFILNFKPLFWTAGYLAINAALDAWYILHPPRGDGNLRQYAKEIFEKDGK